MGLGNFLHGITAQINPFDNGKTYGSYNPPKKKPQPGDPGYVAPVAALKIQNPNQITPVAKQPTNLFQSQANDLKLPGTNTTPSLNLGGTPATPPQPGTIIKPTPMIQPQKINAVPVPNGYEQAAGITGTRTKQNGETGIMTTNKVTGQPHFVPDAPKPQSNSVGAKIGRFFKTGAQTVGGSIANIPEVGAAAVRTGTGIVQGVTQLPHVVTALAATGTQALADHTDNSFTRQLNRGFQDTNTGTKNVTNVVQKPLDFVNKKIDQGASIYAAHVPGASAGDKVYKTTQIPLNVLAALVTGGGSAAAEGGEGAADAGKATGFISKLLNKSVTDNPDSNISKISQTVTDKTAPTVKVLNSPIKSTKNAITKLVNTRSVPTSDDAKIQQILSGDGSNRTDNLRTIEQNQNNLSDTDRLNLAGGDSGQAGLQMAPSARDEMLARFRAQASGGAPAPNVTDVPHVPNPAADLVDAGEAGNVMNGVEDLTRPPVQIPVTQPTPISIGGEPGEPTTIPVTNNTSTGKPIIEVSGDKPGSVKVPTQSDVAAQNATDRFNTQAPGNPDRSIDGITKADTGNASPLFTKAQIANEQAELDAALKSGELDAATHKAASDELVKNSAIDDAPKGKKINVKQVNSIPIENQVDVPTDLPATPGQVAPTTATAPEQTASETVANAPTVAAPTPLPKDVQNVLDNPKQFTKRQVAAARNQRKLARAMAKTQEDTQAAITRMTSDKPVSDKGFVPSGEMKKGATGKVSETAHNLLEQAQGEHDTTHLSVDDVLKQAHQELSDNGIHSPETVRNLRSIKNSGKFAANSPEQKAVVDEYKAASANYARGLALTDRTVRASATGDQLTNRFTNKLLAFADDSGKIKHADIDQINEAESTFTSARDAATQAGEQFKATGSDSDFKAWKAAQTQAETADRHARLTEYLVSKRVLKGNKDINASKAVADAEKNAGVYSMDAIDSNMLSGTGTMARNYINTLFPRAENKLFGRVGSVVARKLTGIDALGGSSGKGARIGSAIGRATYKADLAARKEAGVGKIRRFVTAGNTLGEQNIEATTYSKAFSHYKQVLKDQGYKGKELNQRAEFEARNNTGGLVDQYREDTLKANALSGLTTGNKKIENWLSDQIQQKLADGGVGARGQQVGRLGAKAITRVGLGFPTVIARSLIEGAKRASLGVPEALLAGGKFALTGNKEDFAASLAQSIQHAGSGGALYTLGAALGRAGLITGAYPTDPAEQARWAAEGKQENSIKIGGNYYSIPGYLGGFSLPLQIGASFADGNIKDEASWKNAYNTVLSSSPVDNIQSTLDIVTGNGTDAKTKNAVTSLVRSGTPAGALVAEIAKMTDSTQNDTTTKGSVQNILDSIAGGIPGLNNKVNTIAKTDEYGNPIKNPNPVAVALGAQGAAQGQGTQDVNQVQSASDQTLQQLAGYGVTSNKSLMQLVDPKIAKQIENGQQLSPEDVAKVQAAVTKGITPTEDSNWRESGDYSTDKAALQAKLQLLDTDPTTKPSVKAQYQTQIARDDVLQTNNISYDELKSYEGTSLADWRAMGDPTSDTYDPDTYNALWAIDQKMAAGGGSYNKTDATKQKFSAKSASASGSKGSGLTTDFGKINPGDYAPKVQAYGSIDQTTGQVPVIQVQRPNIVHSISSSG